MSETKKEIPSFRIEVHTDRKSGKPQKAIISPEKEGAKWYREKWNRKKDGVLVPEILEDMNKIGISLCKTNEKGELVGKYPDAFITNLPANPKASRRSRKEYLSYLKEYIKKEGHDKDIKKFYGKKVLIYIAVYLRRSRYEEGNDIDNFEKPILDALKEYIGDDSQVDTLIGEKKLLPNYYEEDLDFIEQVIIAITNPEAKVDILKNMQK